MAEETTEQEAAEAQADPEAVEVSEAELPEANATAHSGTPGQIDILLDSPMMVSATLGEAELPVRDLLRLGPGSVVPLDRNVGEAVDLYLRGSRFATGQMVVVGDHLAVRIKEILSPEVVTGEQEA